MIRRITMVSHSSGLFNFRLIDVGLAYESAECDRWMLRGQLARLLELGTDDWLFVRSP